MKWNPYEEIILSPDAPITPSFNPSYSGRPNPVIPNMSTGSSDSIYTMNAGIPSYGISGVAIDRDDVRAHGKDERVKADSYYTGLEFYYQFLKALTTRTPH